MGRPSRYSPEVRERSVRLVLDQAEKHSSQWAAIQSVASKIGCTPETLRRWVRQAEIDHGRRAGLTTEERARLKQLEDVEFATASWVEWFNNRRLFTPIGDIPPVEYEEMYYRDEQSHAEVA